MIKKAQGLMNDAELQALEEGYDIYVVSETFGEVIDYEPDLDIKLTAGGEANKNLEYYTIDPADYNLLIRISRKIKSKLKLYVIVRFQQDFTISDYAIEVTVPPPTGVLNKYNINTRIKRPKKTIIKRKEIITNEDLFPSFDEAERHLDDVLKQITEYIEKENIPLKPLTLQSYFDTDDILFTLAYNANIIHDEKVKEQNVVFPPEFTEGFEKYFTPDASRRVLKKIRKIINRSGNRDDSGLNMLAFSQPYYRYNIEDKSEHESYVRSFLHNLSFISNFLNQETQIKELSSEVFNNMKNYILSALENYYYTKGFSRPLTAQRLTAVGISREVNSLIRTAVTSSLPGFQTSTGKHKGYTFNKSVLIDPSSPLSFLEAVIKEDPKTHDIIDMKVSNLLNNQPIPPSIFDNLFEKDPYSGIINLVGREPRISLANGFGSRLLISSNAKINIYDERTERPIYYDMSVENITNAFKNNPQDTVGENLRKVPLRISPDELKRTLPNLISNVVREHPVSSRDSFTPGNSNEIFVPITIIPNRSNRLEQEITMIFKFSFEKERDRGLLYVDKLTLESVEVAFYRRRTINRKFEIDINAEYGFDLEIRRVIKRVLEPQNFYSSDRPDINQTDKSAAFIQSIVRSINKQSYSYIINIDPPKFDSLTGATRGIWLINSGGLGTTYLTIDDSKTGAGANAESPTYTGSACMGTFNLWRSDTANDPSTSIEHKGIRYHVELTNSNCINFLFPDKATERDVEQGLAERVGDAIARSALDKRTGLNLDPMGSSSFSAFMQGSDLGKPAVGGRRVLSEGNTVHMPTFIGNREIQTFGNLRFNMRYNTIGYSVFPDINPDDNAEWEQSSGIKFSDIKPILRALNGYKSEEISRLKEPSDGNFTPKFEQIMDILGVTYETKSFENIPPNVDDNPVRLNERLMGDIANRVFNSTRSPELQMNTVEEIRPIVEANKDEIKEMILMRVGLGADYSSSDRYPNQPNLYSRDFERQVKRREMIK